MDTEKRMDTPTIMKYFTPLWYGEVLDEELSDEEATKIRDSYWEYIENISEQLSFPLRMLAKQINLHDAVVTKFCYNSKEKSVFLQAYGGDLQVGYFCLECNYSGVSKYWNSLGENGSLIQKEVLSDEIEMLQPQCFSQRFLFKKLNEMEIVFENVSISLCTINADDYLNLLEEEE